MPKVLRIINRLNLGGPTYNASYLTKYMDGYETMLAAGMKDKSEASSEFIVQNLGIEPVYIKSMRRSIDPFKDLQAYKQIKNLISKFKPDIVHTHAAKPGALGRLAAYHMKVPVILHTFHGHVFHSYFHPAKTQMFIRIEKFLAGISTGIIAISNIQKHELTEVYNICNPDKVHVIPLGFDLARFQSNMAEKRNNFRRKFNLYSDEIAIGIVGRLVPIKNHKLFLDSIKQVISKTSKRIRALIIGDGEDRESIMYYARELGLEYATGNFDQNRAPIIFTSWIKEIDEANAGLDIMTLTSFNEGTPVSLIEAQAANLAIVTTAVGGINDVVMPEETALLSPSGDVEKFSENLLKLIEDVDFRKSMGRRGYEHVSQKYNFIRLVSDTKDLYDKLLHR